VRPTLGVFGVRLALISVGALAVRLAWVLGYARHQPVAGDQVFYHLQARALAQGDGYVNPYAWNDPVTPLSIPTAAHPPLYSTYLAVWSWFGADSVMAHRLASVLLGVACVVVVGLVARRLAGDIAGLVAAGAAAVYPNLWINDGLLAAESAYALGIAVMLLAAYRLWDRRRLPDAAFLGAAIALAALARAEGMLLFVTVALPLVALLPHSSRYQRVRLLGVVAVTGMVVLAPWVGRNLTTWDQPVLMSTGAGFVIEIANCDATYSGRFLGYWSTECDRDHTWPVQAAIEPGMSSEQIAAAQQAARIESARREPVVEQRKRAEGLRYLRANLGDVPRVVAARLGRMWDVWRPAQSVEFNDFFERRGRRSTMAGMAVYYLLVPAAIGGAVVLRRRRVTIVPFVGVALSVCVAAAASFGITRYRVGVEVVLCVLAGVAVAALAARRARPVGEGAPDAPGPPEPPADAGRAEAWRAGAGGARP
jgi:hypothetical protein